MSRFIRIRKSHGKKVFSDKKVTVTQKGGARV